MMRSGRERVSDGGMCMSEGGGSEPTILPAFPSVL